MAESSHRHLWILAAVLVAGLIWSYLLTHPGEEGTVRGQGTVRLWDIPLNQVSTLKFRDGVTRVSLEVTPRDDREVPDLWVKTTVLTPVPTPKSPSKLPPGKAQAPQKAGPERNSGKPQARAFKGNAAALASLRTFAKVRITRDLGPLAGLDAADFGLESHKGNGKNGTPEEGGESILEIHRTESKPSIRLLLGRVTYGKSGRYVLDRANGRVYLMRNVDFRKLAQAHRSMMDRQLLGLNPKDVVRLEVSLGSARQEFRKDASTETTPNGIWRDRNDAERSDVVGRLLKILATMRVREYLNEDEAVQRRARPDSNGLTLRLWLNEAQFSTGRDALKNHQLRLGGIGTPMSWGESTHTGRPVAVQPTQAAAVLKAVQAVLPQS